jgi:hypothetical protein
MSVKGHKQIKCIAAGRHHQLHAQTKRPPEGGLSRSKRLTSRSAWHCSVLAPVNEEAKATAVQNQRSADSLRQVEIPNASTQSPARPVKPAIK